MATHYLSFSSNLSLVDSKEIEIGGPNEIEQNHYLHDSFGFTYADGIKNGWLGPALPYDFPLAKGRPVNATFYSQFDRTPELYSLAANPIQHYYYHYLEMIAIWLQKLNEFYGLPDVELVKFSNIDNSESPVNIGTNYDNTLQEPVGQFNAHQRYVKDIVEYIRAIFVDHLFQGHPFLNCFFNTFNLGQTYSTNAQVSTYLASELSKYTQFLKNQTVPNLLSTPFNTARSLYLDYPFYDQIGLYGKFTEKSLWGLMPTRLGILNYRPYSWSVTGSCYLIGGYQDTTFVSKVAMSRNSTNPSTANHYFIWITGPSFSNIVGPFDFDDDMDPDDLVNNLNAGSPYTFSVVGQTSQGDYDYTFITCNQLGVNFRLNYRVNPTPTPPTNDFGWSWVDNYKNLPHYGTDVVDMYNNGEFNVTANGGCYVDQTIESITGIYRSSHYGNILVEQLPGYGISGTVISNTFGVNTFFNAHKTTLKRITSIELLDNLLIRKGCQQGRLKYLDYNISNFQNRIPSSGGTLTLKIGMLAHNGDYTGVNPDNISSFIDPNGNITHNYTTNTSNYSPAIREILKLYRGDPTLAFVTEIGSMSYTFTETSANSFGVLDQNPIASISIDDSFLDISGFDFISIFFYIPFDSSEATLATFDPVADFFQDGWDARPGANDVKSYSFIRKTFGQVCTYKGGAYPYDKYYATTSGTPISKGTKPWLQLFDGILEKKRHGYGYGEMTVNTTSYPLP